MKTKLTLLISTLSILAGIAGFIYINTPPAPKLTFDPSIKSDESVFASKEQRHTARIASIKRLATKKDRTLRTWILKNFETMDIKLKKVSLEEIGNYSDKDVNKFIFNNLGNTQWRRSALKALSKAESDTRAQVLSEFSTKGLSNIELIDYHFASFKSNRYFSKKKIHLNYLIKLARNSKDGGDLDYLVNSLSIHVPNFEKFHDLLKKLLFKSNSIAITQLSIKHLSVYRKGWLKIQMKKIFESENESKIKFYLDKAPVLCPLGYWKIMDEYYSKWKEYILYSAFSLNTKKAKDFLLSKEEVNSRMYNSFKIRLNENVKFCY